MKDKDQDFTSARFYYNLNAINPTITDIYDTDGHLNQSNLANGSHLHHTRFSAEVHLLPGSEIAAAFAEANTHPIQSLFGVKVWAFVTNTLPNGYATGTTSFQRRSELNTDDFFPAWTWSTTSTPPTAFAYRLPEP